MKQIKKQYAANATHTALHLLYEAEQLHGAAHFIEERDNPEDISLDVLRFAAGDKANEAFEAINFVDNYFRQEPKKKAKKKLAVVKKAA
jgi:hypothetical protein